MSWVYRVYEAFCGYCRVSRALGLSFSVEMLTGQNRGCWESYLKGSYRACCKLHGPHGLFLSPLTFRPFDKVHNMYVYIPTSRLFTCCFLGVVLELLGVLDPFMIRL